MGFLKAGSKVSLITSAISAALLIVTTMRIFEASVRTSLAQIIMAALIVVFAIRLAKTKKFMPSGLMFVLTIAALTLYHFAR